ncbi:plasmid stabilization system protein ParE [Flavobacterium cutihirudinis]|uniref:Plasmid stabilization system protein ParE n=1 Tax=Flavobacterium cutihirudinis TaxID=1265740 RepID=A0A3D9G0K2_9FLAO|nr:type II toxin-antitoxin system RelE/ParE family toxin [Flavobacterium cutihirudinis]RED26760.1 plasmid stabilization system protein ParE [Flavobacterium cutihirudinis]
MDKSLKVVWTNTAKNELKTIFSYYKEKSLQGANNLKNEILKVTKEIHFSEQYQSDEIEPEYRRIIVRDYKILYLVKDEILYISKIFSTKRDFTKQL